MFVLFFLCYGHRRLLHSFPTRRSSDLFVLDFVAIMPGTPKNKVKSRIILTPQHAKRRSEEHTSELQSRPHLVCRLLLEKKKAEALMRARGDILLGRGALVLGFCNLASS